MHLSGLFSEEQARSTAKYMEWLMRMDKDKDHIERTKRMIEVMQAYVDGEKIEICLSCDPDWRFVPCNEVNWNWQCYNYRIAKTPDTINWDHVAPEFKYMARDEDGCACLHIDKPFIEIGFWVNGYKLPVDTHSSYRKGTVDWKESLVIRPGCE